jgi:hypothetical protein
MIRKPFRLGLLFADTRVGRARASRPTHSLCYVTPLAYSDVEPWECWNGGGLLALKEVRFANGLTLSFKVLPSLRLRANRLVAAFAA